MYERKLKPCRVACNIWFHMKCPVEDFGDQKNEQKTERWEEERPVLYRKETYFATFPAPVEEHLKIALHN